MEWSWSFVRYCKRHYGWHWQTVPTKSNYSFPKNNLCTNIHSYVFNTKCKIYKKKCSAFSNFHVQFILPLTNRKKCTNMMNMTIVQCQRYGFIDRFCIRTQTWLFHKYCSLCVVSTIAVNNISFTGLEHYTTQTIK